jgi:hypothetical protein
MGRKAQTLESLLGNTIMYEGEACLLWRGCKDKDGYGLTSIKGIKMPAHRAVMSFLEDVTGKYVLHTCSNRHCVSPKHLYVGTQKQNVQDQINAGTFVHGSKNGKAILTEEIVKECRQSPKNCRTLADEFNVSYYTMWDVLKRRSWTRVQ